ncbi:MAG: signal peptidase II [Gemmatimonadota bacterium]
MEGAPEAVATPRALELGATAFVPLAVVILDQLAKWWVRAELTLNQPVSIVGDNVRLLYIHNEGAAFGISIGEHSSTLFLALASAASILVLYLLLATPVRDRLQRLALGLILGGAVGNIIDRVRFGEVVDFIQVGVSGHYWPIFNVADSAVTVGAVLLGIAYLSDR